MSKSRKSDAPRELAIASRVSGKWAVALTTGSYGGHRRLSALRRGAKKLIHRADRRARKRETLDE